MRVILTSSNSKLTSESKELLEDLELLFPSAEPIARKGRSFKKFLANEAPEECMIIRLDQVDISRRRILIMHKNKEGNITTSTYSLVSFVLCKNLGGVLDSGHMPELAFSGFSEEDNDHRTVEDMQRIFEGEPPEFEGRQIVSFTKKRGFIMCRKHRYIIRLPEDPTQPEKARLEEIGPRISLKLQTVDIDENYIFRHKKNIKLKD